MTLPYSDALRMPVSQLKQFLQNNGCKGFPVHLAPKIQLVKWACGYEHYNPFWHLANGYDVTGRRMEYSPTRNISSTLTFKYAERRD